jgi:DNA-binding NarL/FixJ family response regulator
MAESLQERFGTPMWPVYRIEYAQEVARVRVRLTQEQMDAAWDAGRRLPDDALIAEAIAAARQLASTPRPETTPSQLPSGLTSREVDVLRLLATGATNPEIAETLFISVTTVKGHVQSIMRKLDMSSRSALAAWAVRTGIAKPG